MKVSQFGASLLAAWEKAVQGDLVVPCGKGEPGRKAAVHLRYRMYRLRTAMGKEFHPLHEAALRCKLQLTIENGEHTVRGAAADNDLETLLTSAGVSIPEAPSFGEDLS